MSTPTPSPQGPGGGPNPLLVGGVSFAAVFVLIVGGALGYVGLTGGESTDPPTSSASASSTPETTSASPTEEERCWSPMDYQRTSTNPSGRLRGGGLEIVPPTVFDGRGSSNYASFLNDDTTASAVVEGNWASMITVGLVQWQPGVEYPGNEAASQRIFTCLYSNGAAWGDTSGRTMHDQLTEAVTVAGMSGYRTTGELRFGQDDLELTDASRITVVVLESPQGPSVFLSEVAVGVTEHEDAAREAYDSITGVSG